MHAKQDVAERGPRTLRRVRQRLTTSISPRRPRSDDLRSARHHGSRCPISRDRITENMVMQNGGQMVETLRKIRALGVHVAVDDFGTGYSSLSYLKRFPVDRLKVDRSFVRDLGKNDDDAAIVRTIIALGHNLGLKVVAEGVAFPSRSRAGGYANCSHSSHRCRRCSRNPPRRRRASERVSRRRCASAPSPCARSRAPSRATWRLGADSRRSVAEPYDVVEGIVECVELELTAVDGASQV
jgi:EAL domain